MIRPEAELRFEVKPTTAPSGKDVPVLPFELSNQESSRLASSPCSLRLGARGAAHPAARVPLREGALHTAGTVQRRKLGVLNLRPSALANFALAALFR